MAIEPKEALGLMGYDPEAFEDTETFRAQVEKDWIKRETAHEDRTINGKALAKMNGTLRTLLNGIGKDLGIDADFKGMDPDAGIKTVVEYLKTANAELKEAKGDGSTAKEVSELQKRVDELTKAKKEIEGARDEAVKKFMDFETTVNAEKMAAKVGAIYARAYDKIPFKKDLSKYERAGFDQYVRDNYRITFDEDGAEVLTDKEGNRIKHPKKAGHFLDLDEALISFAESEKLTEIKGAAPAEVKRRVIGSEENEERKKQPEKPRRRLAY